MASKITAAKPTGSFNGSHGTMYTTQITLDDGTSGEVNSKTPDRWNVGDEVVVTSRTDTQYGTKLRIDKADYAAGGAGQKSRGNRGVEVAAQWAINAAIAALKSEERTLDTIEHTANALMEIRDRIIAKDQPQNQKSDVPF